MLARSLDEEGYEAVVVGAAEVALEKLRTERFDVCILDVILPSMDGLSALAAARSRGIATPVLLLTAREGVADRVRGLQLGADDYMTKPFAFAELVARLQAIHRRSGPHREPLIAAGGLVVDVAAHRITIGETELELSQKQFALLALLLRNRGHVVTRAVILENVFGYSFTSNTNIVDVHISHLRQKLAACGCTIRIATIRGVGYRVETDDDT